MDGWPRGELLGVYALHCAGPLGSFTALPEPIAGLRSLLNLRKGEVHAGGHASKGIGWKGRAKRKDDLFPAIKTY